MSLFPKKVEYPFKARIHAALFIHSMPTPYINRGFVSKPCKLPT